MRGAYVDAADKLSRVCSQRTIGNPFTLRSSPSHPSSSSDKSSSPIYLTWNPSYIKSSSPSISPSFGQTLYFPRSIPPLLCYMKYFARTIYSTSLVPSPWPLSTLPRHSIVQLHPQDSAHLSLPRSSRGNNLSALLAAPKRRKALSSPHRVPPCPTWSPQVQPPRA